MHCNTNSFFVCFFFCLTLSKNIQNCSTFQVFCHFLKIKYSNFWVSGYSKLKKLRSISLYVDCISVFSARRYRNKLQNFSFFPLKLTEGTARLCQRRRYSRDVKRPKGRRLERAQLSSPPVIQITDHMTNC